MAGTGKSLLALEKARKAAAKGKRVLYLCFNKNMSRYALQSLNSLYDGNLNVSTYHALIQKALNSDRLYNYDVDSISNRFMENLPDVRKYDYIVIDEAQDLMYISVIEVLEHFIEGGFLKGKWVMFLDPNQNIFNKTEDYSFAWEYLKEAFSPTILKLHQNCRNTEQIGRKTSVLTLVPPAKHMKIAGPKVVIKPYVNSNDLVKKLRTQLTSLLAGGISPLDVVILSKYKLKNSSLAAQKSMCNLEICEVNDISEFGRKSLNFFTVQSFKGLESKVVILIDIDGFEKEEDRMLNYVAMSRAKVLLYIFYDEEKLDEYREITERGQELLY